MNLTQEEVEYLLETLVPYYAVDEDVRNMLRILASKLQDVGEVIYTEN